MTKAKQRRRKGKVTDTTLQGKQNSNHDGTLRILSASILICCFLSWAINRLTLQIETHYALILGLSVGLVLWQGLKSNKNAKKLATVFWDRVITESLARLIFRD